MLALFVLPQYYISQSLLVESRPVITNVSIYPSEIILGNSYNIRITAINIGSTADYQNVELAFPNLTSINTIHKNVVSIKQSDFTRQPILTKVGMEIASNYGKNTVSAIYPSFEFFSTPWHSNDTHHLDTEIKPDKIGRFVVFIKSVALPHTTQLSHYPQQGPKDYQGEFVAVYEVDVKKV